MTSEVVAVGFQVLVVALLLGRWYHHRKHVVASDDRR